MNDNLAGANLLPIKGQQYFQLHISQQNNKVWYLYIVILTIQPTIISGEYG